MREYVLLLGANQYLRERALAGAKAASDLPVWTADPDTITKRNRYFDACIEANPQSSTSLLSAIQLHQQNGWTPKAVIPLNDWTLKAATEVNQALGLKHLSEETVFLARNKFAMKEAFLKHNVKTAPFQLIEHEHEMLSALDEIGLPVIIKPYDFGGSGGVYLARTAEEAIVALQESKEIMQQYAQQFNVEGNKYLIEKYIDSREEVSVEVLCFNHTYQTVTITEKYLSPEPWFAEMAHLVPSHRVNDAKLHELAHRACQALGIEFGLAHVEIKIKDHEGWVIEAAARPGGDGIMDQIERAYGINPYQLHVSAYLDQDPLPLLQDVKPQRTAAIAFLKAKTGTITDIKQPDSYPEGTHSLLIQAKIGGVSEDPICWRAREGVIEYTWPTLFEEKTNKPIQLTNELSHQIFQVEVR